MNGSSRYGSRTSLMDVDEEIEEEYDDDFDDEGEEGDGDSGAAAAAPATAPNLPAAPSAAPSAAPGSSDAVEAAAKPGPAAASDIPLPPAPRDDETLEERIKRYVLSAALHRYRPSQSRHPERSALSSACGSRIVLTEPLRAESKRRRCMQSGWQTRCVCVSRFCRGRVFNGPAPFLLLTPVAHAGGRR